MLKARGAANGTLPKVDPSFVPMIHVVPKSQYTRSKVPPEQHADAYMSLRVWFPHSACEHGDLLDPSEQSCNLHSADLSDTFVTSRPLRAYVMGTRMQHRAHSILSFCVPVQISNFPMSDI
jgi:hypothetical protein